VHPEFLPDGRRFLFYAFGFSDGVGVYVGSLDSQDVRRVIRADAAAVFLPPDRLLLARDDALLAQSIDLGSLEPRGEPVSVATNVFIDFINGKSAVSASRRGPIAYRGGAARELVWLDRAGRRIGNVGDLQPGGPMVVLSPDGGRAVISRRVEGHNDLWVLDLSRNAPRRITRDAANEMSPVWSPDGSKLVFGSDRRSGVLDLYVRDMNDGSERALVESTTDKHVYDWSRDGKWIVHTNTDPKNGWDLWATSVAGVEKPFPVAVSPAQETAARLSPDGRWIAFQSNESSRFEVYAQPFPGPGPRVQISTEGGVDPHWGSGGRELFYRSQGSFVSVPVQIGAGGIKAGRPVPLFDLSEGGGGIQPMTDGQRFLANIVREAPLVTVLINWSGGRSR
jgi:Tol biopolymer transport system component